MIIFFDRDGVLVPSVEIENKPKPVFKIGDKIDINLIEAITSIQCKPYLFMVTNQPDISRGKKNQKEIENENNYIKQKFNIDDWAMCIHDNSHNCNCRKPKPGLLEMLIKNWDIKIKEHELFMIGDRTSDIVAGNKIGCKGLFIDYGYKETGEFQDYHMSFSRTIDAIQFIKKNYI